MERRIIQSLRKHHKFIVSMHVNPDPDAVAAALALTLFLRAQGKKVRMVNQDDCPSWLNFVPRISLYEKFDEVKHGAFAAEVLVVLDCGDLKRLGSVARLIRPGVQVINIDHHCTNENFGDLNLVEEQYSSTSEILFRLLKKAKCHFTKDIAMLLYLGILTDTGSFGFDCTSSHTHTVVAELLKFKFSVSDMYGQAYETLPRRDLKPFLALMNRLELFYGERVACLALTGRDLGSVSDEFDLKDKVFTFLRSVQGLEVIVILTEQGKEKTRLNFRSRGSFDVARLAGQFGGGGHKKASGGFLDQGLTKAKSKVLAAIGKAL
ncbi:MAG: bifunctional oligoribonuclease/PAP phosphatase NrnA [Candidatus Omnitrophica bacterium]|nr:bifunctional oligoribonuclease/PAP phosphatase NrnA [Candidatus Omnitrophota bacterium]